MFKLTAVSANEKVYLTGEAYSLDTPLYLYEGDSVSLQLNITSEYNYRNVAVRLVGGPAARAASFRRVGLVPAVLAADPSHDDYYEIREDHLYPDVLEKCNPLLLHGMGGVNETLFVTIKDNEKIAYGKHKLVARLYENGKYMTRATFEVIKLPARLPEQKCKLTTWMHYDSFIDQHHVKLFTKDFYKLFASYLEKAVIGGQNMLLVPLFTPAFDTQIGGERHTAQLLDISEPQPGVFTFDFTKTNEFIRFALSHGMKYLEMPPCYTQWGAKNAPKILVRDQKGRLRRRFGWETDALSDEYKNFLRQMLTALNANLREIGAEEISFFHISDEPSLEQYDQYMACKNFIMPLIGKSNTLDACSHLEFAGKTDREYSVCLISTVDKYIEAGIRPLCTYYCCGPVNSHYTNRFLSLPLPRVSVLGLQLYRYDMDLFLQWGFNFYNSMHSRRSIVPYNNTDSDAVFSAGDAFIVYPDYAGFGTNASLRLYAMGTGMKISRMLYLYESLTSRETALAFLDEEGVTGLNVYPTEHGWLDRLTARLCEKIAEKLA
jgi:hypothetical protein